MNQQSYVFANAEIDPERERLETVQAVFDPVTHHCLERIGVAPGWTCLEVGAGAGSIMRWLCDRVGESGRTVAVDIDPRFVEGTQLPNLEIRRLDITTGELEHNFYDLVHVRAVSMHLRDRDSALQSMVRALKPGGWLLVEEPDFATAMSAEMDSTDPDCVTRVFDATRKLYETMQVDPYLGRKLPLILQGFNFESVEVIVNAELFQGGSLRAKIWRMAVENIESRLLDLNLCTITDIEQFIQKTRDPACWMSDYSIASAWGQKV